jgi:hypothetical protein
MNKFILEYGSIVNNEAPMNPFRNLSSEISLISVRGFPQAQFRAVTKAIFLYLPLFWPGWGPSTGSTVNGCALFVSELLARLEIQSVEDNRKKQTRSAGISFPKKRRWPFLAAPPTNLEG